MSYQENTEENGTIGAFRGKGSENLAAPGFKGDGSPEDLLLEEFDEFDSFPNQGGIDPVPSRIGHKIGLVLLGVIAGLVMIRLCRRHKK